MTNCEWLAKYMHVTDMNEVFKYSVEQGFCLSPWHDGCSLNCPFADDDEIDCPDCFMAWLNQNYYEGTE